MSAPANRRGRPAPTPFRDAPPASSTASKVRGRTSSACRSRRCGGWCRRYNRRMLISADLAKAFNEQIGHEFGASMQYVSIAAHFSRQSLTLLSKLFLAQADEEKE